MTSVVNECQTDVTMDGVEGEGTVAVLLYTAARKAAAAAGAMSGS
jgi:hypothetical protein